MAYCVNCGVELDSELEKCPLCGTPVYRPKENTETARQTFPEKRGEVEKVSRKDGVIFISVLAVAIMATCGLLNSLVYDQVHWSVIVDGICIVFWVFFMTALFVDIITGYGMLFINALAIANSMYFISRITSGDAWVYRIGLPILAVVWLLSELFYLLSRKFPFSFLSGTLYFFIGAAVICATVESVLDLFFHDKIQLSWSAIVLTVCGIIAVILIMTLMMSRVRNSVRRRLHF